MPRNSAEYQTKYAKEKLKRIPLDVPKDWYPDIKAAAEKAGQPVNGYIKASILQRMENEGYTGEVIPGKGSPDLDDTGETPD